MSTSNGSPNNWCRYCAAPIPPRMTTYGTFHGTQPTYCCPEHAKRDRAWNRWIDETRWAAARGLPGARKALPAGQSVLEIVSQFQAPQLFLAVAS